MALAWPSLWELLLVSFRAPACRWSVLGLYTHHAHSRGDRTTPTLPPPSPGMHLQDQASNPGAHGSSIIEPHSPGAPSQTCLPLHFSGEAFWSPRSPPEWENSACFFVISSLLHLRSLLAGNCSGSRCSSCSGTGSLPVAAAY